VKGEPEVPPEDCWWSLSFISGKTRNAIISCISNRRKNRKWPPGVIPTQVGNQVVVPYPDE
jgi:hypothetical protein